MKIFYAIQATGNGHISRAIQLYPYLQKYGKVDFLLSGTYASLNPSIPIKYRSNGLSLHYSQCGGLDYWNIAKKVAAKTAPKAAAKPAVKAPAKVAAKAVAKPAAKKAANKKAPAGKDA